MAANTGCYERTKGLPYYVVCHEIKRQKEKRERCKGWVCGVKKNRKQLQDSDGG